MRLLSWLADVARNRSGGLPRPRFVTYAVTLRCNATCGACDSWRLPRGPELTPDEAGAAFADLGRLDAVRLTGGEPTLRADLPALADAVRRASRPRVLHLTTHGGFPDRAVGFAEGYAEPSRLSVLVSFDGLAAEHDRSRGRAVSFERALETVRRLAALRARGVRVAVNHTIVSPVSLADAEGLRALCRREGAGPRGGERHRRRLPLGCRGDAPRGPARARRQRRTLQAPFRRHFLAGFGGMK